MVGWPSSSLRGGQGKPLLLTAGVHWDPRLVVGRRDPRLIMKSLRFRESIGLLWLAALLGPLCWKIGPVGTKKTGPVGTVFSG